MVVPHGYVSGAAIYVSVYTHSVSRAQTFKPIVMTRSRKARSKASKDAHLAKYLASASRAKALKGLEANTGEWALTLPLTALLSQTLERQHIQFNDLATRLPSNAERLNRVIARNFPGLNAENLQPADSNHRLFFAEDTTGNPLAM